MIRTLALTPDDRLLVVAPHPDDESLATGGLLQHALDVGSRPVVVFFTDGDNNPWAQRACELRWRIAAVDRARFGARRRREARAALGCLGVAEDAIRFLGFPDQGITDLLLRANEVAIHALDGVLREWRPTVVVGPSLLDLHPDHSALGVLLRLAMERLPASLVPRAHLRFLVHNPALLAQHEGALVLPLAGAQTTRKRAAIACHRTQLVLRSTWLFSFARLEERYYPSESPVGDAQHPVRGAASEGCVVEIPFRSRTLLRSFGSRTLCLAAGPADAPVRLAVDLPSRPGPTGIRDLRAGTTTGEAEFLGRGGSGRIRIPADLLPASGRLFAKIERAFGFFDEAGWREIPPAESNRQPGRISPEHAD